MFQAGFARVEITPPLGNTLDGAATRKVSVGILDPLELNCVAFSDGENKAVLIAADFLYVMENCATEIRELIEKNCGIPAQNVFMQGLHQHTSARIGCRAQLGGEKYRDLTYLDVLYRKYCDVVNMALADLKDATVHQAEKETPDKLAFIRRYRMKDGAIKTNPGRGKGDLIECPLGKADNTVRLIRFIREGGNDIALLNFSTHPDVVGGFRYSADWPGFARRYTEKAMPGVKCILVNGAQGDSNHINPFNPKEVDEKRTGYSHADYMGKMISDTALSIWDQVRPLKIDKIWAKIDIIYVPTNTSDIDRIDELTRYREDYMAGKCEKPKFDTQVRIWRASELKFQTIFQRVPVCALFLGELGFVGFGGEPFMRYAEWTREIGKDMYIITACLTGGGQGYLPTEEAFDEGGYEASNSRFDPCIERMMRQATEQIFTEYRKEK